MAAERGGMVEAERGKMSWEEFFMSLAAGVSLGNEQASMRVGCVLVDSKTMKILSIGYNGYPPKIAKRVKKNRNLIVHAEANAILLKGAVPSENSTAFTTMFPCVDCAKMLIQAGVKRVYYLVIREEYRESEELFQQANVVVSPFPRCAEDNSLKLKERMLKRLKEITDQMKNEIDNSQRMERQEFSKLKEAHKDLRESDVDSRWKRSPDMKDEQDDGIAYERELEQGEKSKADEEEKNKLALEGEEGKGSSVPDNGSQKRKIPDKRGSGSKKNKVQQEKQSTASSTKEQGWPEPAASSTKEQGWPEPAFKNLFLFLSLLASTKSHKEAEKAEGCLLVNNAKTLELCALSYHGRLRGIEKVEKKFVVSAITNCLMLRFWKGSSYLAFATHPPSAEEAKNVAQAGVDEYYFLSPCGLTGEAVRICEESGTRLIPMDFPFDRWQDMLEDTFSHWERKDSKIAERPGIW